MKSSLPTIQKLSKAGKIISKIVMVCCIVGAALTAVGLITVACGWDKIMEIGEASIKGIVKAGIDMSKTELCAIMGTAIFVMICEAISAKLSANYFEKELEAGTPFTYDGAKQFFRLGVSVLIISLVSSTVVEIVASVLEEIVDSVKSINVGLDGLASMGIAFMVVSVIMKYGAEISEGKKEES